jgi:hypothetical protein
MHYCGDVNLEHGGTYFNLSTWHDGYVEAVRVEDLDSACGVPDAFLVEHLTILLGKERLRDALPCVGLTPRDLLGIRGHENKRAAIAEALLSYGHYDPDDCWDNYQTHWSIVVHADHENAEPGDMLEGWTVEYVLAADETLEQYVEREHIRW